MVQRISAGRSHQNHGSYTNGSSRIFPITGKRLPVLPLESAPHSPRKRCNKWDFPKSRNCCSGCVWGSPGAPGAAQCGLCVTPVTSDTLLSLSLSAQQLPRTRAAAPAPSPAPRSTAVTPTCWCPRCWWQGWSSGWCSSCPVPPSWWAACARTAGSDTHTSARSLRMVRQHGSQGMPGLGNRLGLRAAKITWPRARDEKTKLNNGISKSQAAWQRNGVSVLGLSSHSAAHR